MWNHYTSASPLAEAMGNPAWVYSTHEVENCGMVPPEEFDQSSNPPVLEYDPNDPWNPLNYPKHMRWTLY